MKMNLRLIVFAFVLSAVSSAMIFSLAHFWRVSAQSGKQISAVQREDAYRANNLGTAQLEQYNHQQGAAEFRRALEINPQMTIARVNLAIALFNLANIEAAQREAQTAADIAPELPQPHYILGLIAKNQNRAEDAVASFRRVLEIDPRDVGANVNLGQIYIQQRKYPEAVAAFRLALDAEPYNATAMYMLATALLRNNAREEGQRLIARFQELRNSGAATSIGQNYLEQGRYAEAVVSTGAESDLVDKAVPRVVFQNSISALPGQKSQMRNAERFDWKVPDRKMLARRFAGGATLFDFDNDGDLDAVKITAAGQSLYRNDKGSFVDATRAAGDLAKITATIGTGVVAGDFDGDGLPDLFVLRYGDNRLYRNEGGKFTDVTAAAKLPKYEHLSISCAMVDVDHDGDLDIFLVGFVKIDERADANDFIFPREFTPAPNMLLRNNGDSTFTDISEAAKIKTPKGFGIAVVPTDYDNRRDIDLLIVNYGERPTLFRNLRDTTFGDVAEAVGLTQKGSWTSVAAGDFNKDGFTDFFFGATAAKSSDFAGKSVFAVSDGRGKFTIKNAPDGTENAASAQFVDYDNDGLLDLIAQNEKGFIVSRNLGDGFTEARSDAFKIKTAANNALENSRFLLAGDVDNDGDEDLFTIAVNGFLSLVKNVGGNSNNSEIVRLTGRASNKTGIGAKIELRSGSLAQKLESYSASPAPAPSDVHFGLGRREKPDAVRVIWTSGTVQAEVEFPEKAKSETAKNFAPFKIEELDRKPSSCPYLYTWNGERFEFITDFLGGGEMGNWQEAGVYHYPDSDEFVRITSDQLKPKDGKYEIRVTNELEEVLFLDYLKLVAIEHDASAEVYPNEGLGIPTAGRRILYTTSNARAPISAVDTNGKSVLPDIENLDRRFYNDFKSLNIRGYAETHNLTLKLDDKKGYDGKTLLLLTGWTDYAFSSDNLAASQSGRSLFLPKLQVKNKRGKWQTVIDSIGISIGRPQTLVVDLTGKFLSDSREVRIVTNFKTFWDKIAVDTSELADVKTIELKPFRADLRERGFSEEIKYGEMIAANYDKVLNDGRWKYFSGNFTKIGAVNLLLEATDDVFVISKTGDELKLSFDALPELPEGKKYTFLLFADGYSKEMDINSGSPDQVFPLPFKAMTKYPYGADEEFPMTEEKRRIYDEYTTRTVRGFLPRLETALLK